MSGISRGMTGTSWHIGHYERKEGDARRHRSRCIHYQKLNGHCTFYCGKCTGTSQCSRYEEISEEEQEMRKNDRTKKEHSKNDEDWILSPGKKKEIPIQHETNQEHLAREFSGIKYISMQNLLVDKRITVTPSKKKIQEVIEYYKKNGTLDKPVVIVCKGDKYEVVDKYLRYYVAKQLNLKEIPAEMGSLEEIKDRDKLRKIGTLVWHKKRNEVGEVINSTLTRVTIRYDSGKENTYEIHLFLKCGKYVVLK